MFSPANKEFSLPCFFRFSTPSTMDFAKEYADTIKTLQKEKHMPLCAFVTLEQTQGRGRGQSVWLSTNLATQENPLLQAELARAQKIDENTFFIENSLNFFSYLPDFPPLTLVACREQIPLPVEWITALVGCALYDSLEALQKFFLSHFPQLPYRKEGEVQNICLKWPNDLVFQQGTDFKKICGILCESSYSSQGAGDFLLGIGLNLFSAPSLERTSSFWDFLCNISEESRNQKRSVQKWFSEPEYKRIVLATLIKKIGQEINEYLFFNRSVEQLKHIVLERSLPIGTMLSVNKKSIQGRFIGLNDQGALLLEGADPVYSADVSIEKIEEEKIKSVAYQSPDVRDVKKVEAERDIIIAFDLGNTRIHLGLQAEERVYAHLAYEDILNLDKAKIRQSLSPILDVLSNHRQAQVLILCCSVVAQEKTLKTIANVQLFLKGLFPEISFLEKQLTEEEILADAPIVGSYEPSRLGSDRALKFYFAYNNSLQRNINSLIFSFGTALTCEGVGAKGALIENFVAPGLQMSFRALHEQTALLPLLKPDPTLFAASEGEVWDQNVYLQRGIFLSAIATIYATIKMHSPCEVFLAGGNAEEIRNLFQKTFPEEKTSLHLRPQLELENLLNIAGKIKKSLTPIAKEKTFSPKGEFFIKSLHAETVSKGDSAKSSHQEPNSKEDFPTKSSIMERIRKKIDNPTEIVFENYRRIGTRIEHAEQEIRLDCYLAQKFPFHTRAEWKERIAAREILIEHQGKTPVEESMAKIHLNIAKPTYHLKKYDQIWIFNVLPPPTSPAKDFSLDVLCDDGDICVFAKPANILVHAAGMHMQNTFVQLLEEKGYKDCAPIHRLDKETSGILISARKMATRNAVSQAFRNGNIKKMYLAVTRGNAPMPEEFSVDLPICEPLDSQIRLKLWVTGEHPQEALTHFTTLARMDDYTLFACFPVTGRTNQIRIHLAASGHWIVGDKMYHPNENVFLEYFEKGLTPWVLEQILCSRHLLHSAGIQATVDIPFLAQQPILCPLPQDFLEFPVTKMLMEKAHMPTDSKGQQEYLASLFQKSDYSGL